MKILLFTLLIFFSRLLIAQSPYAFDNNSEQVFFDRFHIDKGQEGYYFSYALQLYNQDSLQKAGQVFDRIYWLDTTTFMAKRSFFCRQSIEQKIMELTRQQLSKIWILSGANTYLCAGNPSLGMIKKTNRMDLSGGVIKFYVDDSLVRDTKYVLTQSFDWLFGWETNQITYLDTDEEWNFDMAVLSEFISDRLVISKKDTIGHKPFDCFPVPIIDYEPKIAVATNK